MSNFKVLSPNNLEEIFELEKLKLKSLSEEEKMLQSWKAPWRTESLEHYLSAGWCIGLFDPASDGSEKLVAYFLAQPILFMEAMTQTLWIEYLSYSNQEIGEKLVDFAYRYGRDKHLQRVLFNKDAIFDQIKTSFQIEKNNKNYIEVYTTKLS